MSVQKGGSKTRPALRKGRLTTRERAAFEQVKRMGLELPGVQAVTKYDGSPVLKIGNCFMAGLARHASAERDTLVVRMDVEQRAWLLEDAPEVYYLTDYYQKYPLLLVRLSRVDHVALRDLLRVSYRMTLPKTPVRRRCPSRIGVSGVA